MNDLVIYNSVHRITQYFGKGHKGVDLGYSKNEDKNIVYANCQGTVYTVVNKYGNDTKATGSKTWGNYVLIKHPNGMYSRYAHLKKDSITVKKGDYVNSKTPIGIIGNSGRAFGRHLHFEVQTGKSSNTRINPEKYLSTPIYEESDNFTLGTYELLVSKAIRRSPELINNIVKVKSCMSSVKPKLTSKNPNDKAYFKIGSKVEVTEIYKDKSNRIWGKLKNTWIVLCNKDGTPQAKRVD